MATTKKTTVYGPANEKGPEPTFADTFAAEFQRIHTDLVGIKAINTRIQEIHADYKETNTLSKDLETQLEKSENAINKAKYDVGDLGKQATDRYTELEKQDAIFMMNLYNELWNKYKDILKDRLNCLVGLLNQIREGATTKIQKVDPKLTKDQCGELLASPEKIPKVIKDKVPAAELQLSLSDESKMFRRVNQSIQAQIRLMVDLKIINNNEQQTVGNVKLNFVDPQELLKQAQALKKVAKSAENPTPKKPFPKQRVIIMSILFIILAALQVYLMPKKKVMSSQPTQANL